MKVPSDVRNKPAPDHKQPYLEVPACKTKRRGHNPAVVFYTHPLRIARRQFLLRKSLKPAFSKLQREGLLLFNGLSHSSVESHQDFERPIDR